MLTKIRLELARDHDHPDSSHAIGYEFAAPLNGEGKIDAEEMIEKCRNPGDLTDKVHKSGGSVGRAELDSEHAA